MIDDYLSEDGQKALKLTGWPEFLDHEDTKHRLEHCAYRGWVLAVHVLDGGHEHLDTHVALSILRDWFREWLLARKVAAEATVDCQGFYVFRYEPETPDEPWELKEDGTWDMSHEVFRPKLFDDYDRALIAAVLAIEETGP